MTISLSQLVGILSAISAAAAALAAYTQTIRPSVAVMAMGLSVAVNAFTERIQGGKSKGIELTADELEIIAIHREKERQRKQERNG